jgi:hypothetical protein
VSLKLDAEFNSSIDEEHEPVNIPVLGRSRLASDLLAILDPQLYEERRDAWMEDRLAVALGRESLPRPHFVKNCERFDLLARLVARQRVIPFVGAGVSAACGFPTWSAFLAKLAAEHRYPKKKLSNLLAEGRFEDAASSLLTSVGEAAFLESFDRVFARDPDAARDGLARLIATMFRGPVVTTNYDQVLERVASPPFTQVFLGRSPGDFQRAAREGARVLLKVHGNLYEPDSRVLTKDDYDAAYGALATLDAARALPRALRSAFLRETVLFLGASLVGDRTLDVLRAVATDPSERQTMRHCAILELPATVADVQTRERFLADRGIFPIWYTGGDHTVVPEILRHLARVAEGLR